MSDDGTDELRDAVNRPGLRGRFIRATDQEVADYLTLVAALGRRVDPVPAVVTLARDPDDAKHLNLAIAAGANFIVTRDKDLLDLMTGTDADAVAFRTNHPAIEIVTPPAFLARLAPPTP